MFGIILPVDVLTLEQLFPIPSYMVTMVVNMGVYHNQMFVKLCLQICGQF